MFGCHGDASVRGVDVVIDGPLAWRRIPLEMGVGYHDIKWGVISAPLRSLVATDGLQIGIDAHVSCQFYFDACCLVCLHCHL